MKKPKAEQKAKQAQDDAPELIKYRLLGAVVTFVLIALFGPEILDGSGRIHTTPIVEIPDRPDVPPAPILKPPSPKGTGFASVETEPYDQPMVPRTTSAKATEPEVLVSAANPAQEPGWTLQLATFSQPKNAQALRKKLTKAGFNSYNKLLRDSSGKTRYQVFVGPELKKEKLMAVKKQLAAKLKLKDGLIKPYRP